MERRCGGPTSAPRRLAARERQLQAMDQFSLDQWFREIAHDPQSHHALANAINRIGGHENRWDGVPCFDQMFVKIDARHFRHVNIRDQASRVVEFGGCEEFRGGRKYRHRIVHRLEQPSHRVAKRLVVIDDRDMGLEQYGLR